MARTVTDIRKNIETPGLNNVIDEICKGEYVLVLGSEIMLDKTQNSEADGDSAKFFLKKVIESHHLKDVDLETNKLVETFTELTILNSLDPKVVRCWLFDAIATTEFDLDDINPDLINLLCTKCFRMVLTTVYDPSAETLMDAIWGKGKYRIMSIFNRKERDFDFEQNELLGDEYYDVPPTLYYVFGKADPRNSALKFVLDDNDTIDCISRWLGHEVPSKLVSYIDTKKLLVLGCNLKDWCFRFFWYAMRHKSLDKLTKGDIALLLQTEESEQDRNLYTYLTKSVRVNIQPNARDYIHKLAQQLDEGIIASEAFKWSKHGGVFISYAGEDFNIAWNIFTRLRSEGFNVWMDYEKLKVSDKYNERILNAINNCKVFIPVLSPTVARDLDALPACDLSTLSEDKKRFYMKEWEMAACTNTGIEIHPICIFGYEYRKPYHQKVPDEIRDTTVFDWSKEPFYTLVSKIKSALKTNI